MTVTIGVEEEFHLLDPVRRVPAEDAERVLAAAESLGLTIEPELQLSQIEVATGICTTLPELRAQIAEHRRAAVAATADVGLAVAGSGSLPAALDLAGQPYPKRRYQRLIAEYAEVGREQLVCAMQTQVGVEDREQAVAALPYVGAWLPVLLALSASSPYFDGEDTGYASYRSVLWSRWPSAGPPLAFASAAEYDETVAALVASGTVADPGMVYFDVRPSARYPTLEVRICDAVPLLDDAVTLAGLARALVVTALRTVDGSGPEFVPPRPELVRAARWRAGRSGLSTVLIDPRTAAAVPARAAVEALLEHLHPALDELGDRDAMAEGVAAILRRGTSADRQRAAYSRRESLPDAVDDLLAETLIGL
ncbi:MAG TPA: glutamate--cysteine ligase [Mycobacteriales bacterium]|nr:glutamate--cysteine ligase [Mycobacteriales bacterium]